MCQPTGKQRCDKLSSHNSTRVRDLFRAKGNDLIFLAPCSPDLNPIGMAVSKLKTLIRKAVARTCQALWKKVGAVCDLFQPQQCRNCFTAAGCGAPLKATGSNMAFRRRMKKRSCKGGDGHSPLTIPSDQKGS